MTDIPYSVGFFVSKINSAINAARILNGQYNQTKGLIEKITAHQKELNQTPTYSATPDTTGQYPVFTRFGIDASYVETVRNPQNTTQSSSDLRVCPTTVGPFPTAPPVFYNNAQKIEHSQKPLPESRRIATAPEPPQVNAMVPTGYRQSDEPQETGIVPYGQQDYQQNTAPETVIIPYNARKQQQEPKKESALATFGRWLGIVPKTTPIQEEDDLEERIQIVYPTPVMTRIKPKDSFNEPLEAEVYSSSRIVEPTPVKPAPTVEKTAVYRLPIQKISGPNGETYHCISLDATNDLEGIAETSNGKEIDSGKRRYLLLVTPDPVFTELGGAAKSSQAHPLTEAYLVRYLNPEELTQSSTLIGYKIRIRTSQEGNYIYKSRIYQRECRTESNTKSEDPFSFFNFFTNWGKREYEGLQDPLPLLEAMIDFGTLSFKSPTQLSTFTPNKKAELKVILKPTYYQGNSDYYLEISTKEIVPTGETSLPSAQGMLSKAGDYLGAVIGKTLIEEVSRLKRLNETLTSEEASLHEQAKKQRENLLAQF
ncbi:MAG: hypothetical protein WC254_03015 [Candidatus Woesearchaeota archaeon]|jgi:hypothetical protein